MLLLACCCAMSGPAATAADLDPGRVTVSGISSGAYLATQAHLALSGRISGAALLAGGPYGCAEGNLAHALGRCISGTQLETGPLGERARAAAAAGGIDPLEKLADDRVWLFHGQADAVVNAAVMTATRDFYAAFMPTASISLVDDVPVAHGWPTRDQGGPCGEMGADYINACDYDAAGALLQFLYGPLQPPVPAREGGLQPLDQAAIVPAGGSFAAAGFAYIPAACEAAAAECRLHLDFHGCRQGKEFIEDRFASQSGLNDWAESNAIVVLYPQVESSMFNPQGCWDWWGYTGAEYDQKTGKQIAGVAALIDAWSQ
jgi:poly(3-hydroxybutyrate) depolymerase